MEFANRYKDWTVEEWKRVLWSDESKFNLCNSDGNAYVRRPMNQRYNPRYTKGTIKYGGGNIMVWGAFSWYGIGPLHRINGIMDSLQYREILQTKMKPFAVDNMPQNWVFQQDNDPKHKSNLVKNWLNHNNITVLDWPAQSPDLNPIENLWGMFEREMQGQKYSKTEDLFEALHKHWNQLSKGYLEKLVDSMPRRCQEVIKNKGYCTKY